MVTCHLHLRKLLPALAAHDLSAEAPRYAEVGVKICPIPARRGGGRRGSIPPGMHAAAQRIPTVAGRAVTGLAVVATMRGGRPLHVF